MNTAEKIKAHIESKIESGEHILKMPYLVGISGKAGAGKSEAAGFLREIHKYETYSFAAPMKHAVNSLFCFELDDKSDPVPDFEVITVRELYQFFGTEICRNLFGPHFFVWNEAACHRAFTNHQTPKAVYDDVIFHKTRMLHQNSRIVYDDVRFQEEADWILECGGTLIHLTRKGADGKVGIPDHASEQGYQIASNLYRKGENYYEIENSGTVFDLGYQINKVLAAVRLAQTSPKSI